MARPDQGESAAATILERLQGIMSTATVYGDPIEYDGLTVIPASRVTAGGGGGRGIDQEADREGDGGGAGVLARPAGAFVIKDGQVTWKPAFTLETVAMIAMLAIIWLARRR